MNKPEGKSLKDTWTNDVAFEFWDREELLQDAIKYDTLKRVQDYIMELELRLTKILKWKDNR